MTQWRATASLARGLAVTLMAAALALVLGRPVALVLVAHIAFVAALQLLHRPRSEPRVGSRLELTTVHEGQGTRVPLLLEDADDVEVVTRLMAPEAHLAMAPTAGSFTYLLTSPQELDLSPRRWGRHRCGQEKVGLFSAWAGYRWGPLSLPSHELEALPAAPPYLSRAEAPQPLGLIGAHRSRRVGAGTEFAGIRPFAAGDRLRRINWRVSLRTGDLHVVTTRAEEDTALLLVVDGLADHGISGGVGSTESSLDRGVRAAAAIAETHVRGGDRVGLRVLSTSGQMVPYGAGVRHLRRIQGQLARVRPGRPSDFDASTLDFGAPTGTVVIVLSPLLSDEMATAIVRLVRSGLPVMVIDTLPGDAAPGVSEHTDPQVADLAWRLRLAEREQLLERLATTGCPIVPWSGPGTLDEVLHRLARRAQVPRLRTR
jgi:uncharacterized protein (DUF58 family)